MPITKKALKRDNSVPAGTAAPMHVDCECGKHVLVTEYYNECDNCGRAYDASGWIIEIRRRKPNGDITQRLQATTDHATSEIEALREENRSLKELLRERGKP